MTGIFKLKTLVMMQLKDKLDMSFVRTKRSFLFKIMAIVAEIALSGVAFFVFFYLASALKLFSFSGAVPSSLVTAMFTLIFTLAIITCTAGLTNTLYLTADNRVLLTLPVKPNLVFLSKFMLYFVFELKKNAMLLLPMYVAYGIVCHAVWYFYPWLVVCYVLVSLLPVAIGAVLSIPALFISNFIRNYKWLQAILAVIVTGFVGWGFIKLIGLMPENMNIAGRWGTISLTIQQWLDTFARWVFPLNWINLMIIGGTAAIRTHLFTMNTVWGMLETLGTIAVCTGLTYLLARPLFFKMASSQFEFEKSHKKAKKNKVHSRKLAPFVYEITRNFRRSRFVLKLIVSLLILPIAIFFLNKTYAAMNTRLSGQYMTVAFSMLVSLLIVTSDNVSYASVYSIDGNARPIAKTQPIIPQISLVSRLIPRMVVIVLSSAVSCYLWQTVSGLTTVEAMLLALIIVFVGFAHLLWSAEMDVMRPQHDQYATLGLSIDNPNERNSTIIAFLISAAFAFWLYFIMSEGRTMAMLKVAGIAFVFLALRVYLYFARIRAYYAEK
ncbi:MAG: hypothetical protein J1G02_02305 [Clostridiales bacterium]|nr:hypothetical protein [Clostridiales bacterium]